MRNIFYPSSTKIKVTVALVLYVLIAGFFLTSFNTTRSLGQREYSPYEKAGIIVSYPAVFIRFPVIFVSENVFTTETTLNQIMTEDGCRNCTTKEFNKPIKKSTLFGWIAGLVVEIFFLYVLSCFLTLAFSKNRNKT